MLRYVIVMSVMLLAALQGVRGSALVAAEPDSVVLRSSRQQGWLIQETTSFRIVCRPNLPAASRLPAACEALRAHLQEIWLGRVQDDWSPRCEIVVHPQVAGYVQALGADSRQSSGCATIEMERGRVVRRRVDLRADAADWLTTALPHELTHVLLADRFPRQQIPRWADEGIAILAEPLARQTARRQAMVRAVSQAAPFTAGELMALPNYPAGAKRDVFYGQSAALVAFLIERDSPARFLDFLESAQRIGVDRALQDMYQIHSVADLNLRWRPLAPEPGDLTELLAQGVSRITASNRLE